MMRCGLLGEKLGHSYSPAIHAQLADYAYGLYEVAPEDLPAFLTGGDFDALNVTIPYKKAVIPYCTELSPIARRLGRDRKSTRLNSSHSRKSRMPSSA